MDRSTRIGLRLAWGFTLLAGGALPALGDWTVSLNGTTRGLRDVALTTDGVGGVLVRWVDLQEQTYVPYLEAGHARSDGSPPPDWSIYYFVPPPPTHLYPPIDEASDGAGGSIFAIVDARADGVLWAYHVRSDGPSIQPGRPPASRCSRRDRRTGRAR